MQPAPELDLTGERRRQARQIGEDRLGNILGQMGIALDEPDCRRIDQVQIAADQFAEGRV